MFKNKVLPAFLLFFIIIACFCSSAKEGYHIKVNVAGLKDTTSILAYYYGNNQYIKDTTYIDSKGFFEFLGDERLDKGMYIIVLPDQNFFDIIIDTDQHFEIYTDVDALVENIEFKGSAENTEFYNYLRKLQPFNQQMMELRQQISDQNLSQDDRDEILEKRMILDNQINELKQDYLSKFPDGLFSNVLKAQEVVPVPEISEEDEAKLGREALYNRFIVDYWKNIDFSDDRIVRTPVYHQKLNHFFNSVVIQLPDSIISAADMLIAKSRAEEELFKYTVWFVMNFAERSNVMGMDKLFVHMAENYYLTGDAFWIGEEQLERIAKRLETTKPLLIGSKAPNINVFNRNRDVVSLHDIDAKYTVIYFWDSECSFCKKITPKLRGLYHNYKHLGLEVFAMNVEADRQLWIDYIEKHKLDWINVHDPANTSGFRDKYDIYSIPIIYVLDKDKKILAKKINPEQVEDLIMHMERQNE